MAYAILRFNKLKSIGSISSTQKHNDREKDTPNADLEIENTIIHGDKNKTYVESFKEITKDMKIRKNAVYAIECFMSASPEAEFFKSKEKILTWSKKSVDWLITKFGENNIIKTHLHLDETTPHLHTFIIPVKDDKLNARYFIGGAKTRLSEFQTEYHNTVKEFKLDRGIKGSKASHVDIKKFYTHVNESLNKELPKTKFLENSKAYRDRVNQDYQRVYGTVN